MENPPPLSEETRVTLLGAAGSVGGQLHITPKNYDARSFGKSTHMPTHSTEYRTRSTPHSIVEGGVRLCVVFGDVSWHCHNSINIVRESRIMRNAELKKQI